MRCPHMGGVPAYNAAYFHSHIFEMVLPEASTSYSKAPQALLTRASFWEAV